MDAPWTAPNGIDKIGPAWVKILATLTDVPKTSEAQMGNYSYTYATLGDALVMIRKVFAENGCALFQVPFRDGSNVFVSTTVMHESGQSLVFAPLSIPGGSTPQSVGSAVTYARRYAAMAICGLATEDDDGQGATAGIQKDRDEAKAQEAEAARAEADAHERGFESAAQFSTLWESCTNRARHMPRHAGEISEEWRTRKLSWKTITLDQVREWQGVLDTFESLPEPEGDGTLPLDTNQG